MILEQLYYMYYNNRPKSAPNGVIVVYFHLLVYLIICCDEFWYVPKGGLVDFILGKRSLLSHMFGIGCLSCIDCK
jgi:hypothetical protein